MLPHLFFLLHPPDTAVPKSISREIPKENGNGF